jgi:hypothetical protein
LDKPAERQGGLPAIPKFNYTFAVSLRQDLVDEVPVIHSISPLNSSLAFAPLEVIYSNSE